MRAGGGDDQARASISVAVEPEVAFRVFTEEIDRWWRRGMRYRVSGKNRGILHLEPKVGGRLFESVESPSGEQRVFQTGTVTAWEPPSRLVFEWRGINFAPGERTEVEVNFESIGPQNTMVTVTHRGWGAIRSDHPARHGKPVSEFLREMGMWWADLLTSMRLHIKEQNTD